MLNTPPPPPVQPIYQPYGAYNPNAGYIGYNQPQPQPYYGAGYQQAGYPNYMNQSNPYMNNTYNPGYPQGAYNGYMTQSNTNYMNQSYQQGANGQQFNPYNKFKKWNYQFVGWALCDTGSISLMCMLFATF